MHQYHAMEKENIKFWNATNSLHSINSLPIAHEFFCTKDKPINFSLNNRWMNLEQYVKLLNVIVM
jgi:hypothetical protein